PEQVLRRDAVENPLDIWPKDAESRWHELHNLLLRFWRRGDEQTLSAAMNAHGLSPNGAVFTSTTDTAWPAAIALALARGQLLDTLDGDYNRPNLSISTGQLGEIDAAIRTSLT